MTTADDFRRALWCAAAELGRKLISCLMAGVSIVYLPAEQSRSAREWVQSAWGWKAHARSGVEKIEEWLRRS